MSPNSPAIECTGIDKRFDDLKVLDGLNWRVEAGERIALVGRNGAGKSTLLRCLVGLERADAGDARLLGCPSLQLDDETKARIAYVPQLQFGFPELTAQQFLDLIGAFYPRWDRALANRLLDSWDLPRKRMLAGLSLGQLQKLAIIRALATHPEVLLLDEPASALDPVIRRQFVEEVTALAIEDGSTILFTTHILRDVDSVLTRIAAMVGGKIVLDAAVSELRDFHVEAVAESAGPTPTSTAPAGVKAWRIDRSGRMRLCYDRREVDADAVAHWVGTPLRPRPFDLESMVVEWTS